MPLQVARENRNVGRFERDVGAIFLLSANSIFAIDQLSTVYDPRPHIGGITANHCGGCASDPFGANGGGPRPERRMEVG